ncbi:transcriptional regulator, GntR family [Paracoccus alcaliphilus]|uniref:Pyruvate dehydrogenase complex repressor n=1 Tax=Paracoccus alcaliphilus TaxID=34002 RepID=A0A1H8PPH2_9RHOB|nr:FadR/GntR family transcriptional regulator [Paracoccus alcaliphilus]WCR18901.1 FadR family transcriptional regulator [Paracoccus alcaliphilus]SEO43892.1 transcriptional regulator, GntR family [Paracoccus alcaliphilus]
MIAKEVFEPIDHASIVDVVVGKVETMIVDGILKEGVRLPSERELAEAFGVSRPKLREALQILEDRNLVTVRHGDGTFVAELTGRAMSPAMLSLYARHGDALYDYLEYRREQEGFASRLAAQRATQADKFRLAAVRADLEQSWESEDPDAAREADFRLHVAVVDASHNTTLIHMMASVYDLTRKGIFYNRDLLRTMDNSGRDLLEQHLEIIDAIIAGDAERAEKAARNHIDFVEHSLRLGQELQRRERRAAMRMNSAE